MSRLSQELPSRLARRSAPRVEPLFPSHAARLGAADRIERSLVHPHDLRPIAPSPAHIRERAYYLFLSRSGCNGSAEHDWLLAERQLDQEYQAALKRYRRQR